MAINPRSFQQVYNIFRRIVENRYPDADFSEGSFSDLYGGSVSLVYQELQSYLIQEFRKTWITNPNNTGQDLENLAVDHFGPGAARPGAQNAFGTITITRQAGNNNKIDIDKGDTFTVGDLTFVAFESVSILAASASGSVILQASEAGEGSNIPASSTWTSDVENVDITNSQPFQGGAEELNDEDYRRYITNFVESVQDGTALGLEGTARLVPGVGSAKVIKNLVDVGTLDSTGALETGGDLFRFKDIRLVLYVGGTTTDTVNSAILSLVETRIKAQLSAGETISVLSASPRSIDWTVDLTFVSSSNALALSQKRAELKTAFEQAINNLNIGTDFDRATVAASVISDNGWNGLFTVATQTPAGDITIANNQKAVPGTITINIV